MRDDPIRAALKAAAQKLRQDCDVWCADHARELAAAAIAAFLRYWSAQTDATTMIGYLPGDVADELADAVECAAKEAGDADPR